MEDLTQEVCTGIVQRRADIAENGPIRQPVGWICGVISKKVAAYWRQVRVKEGKVRIGLSRKGEDEKGIEPPDPRDERTHAELTEAVQVFLNERLDDRERAIAVLLAEGESQSEIAARYKRNPGTISRWVAAIHSKAQVFPEFADYVQMKRTRRADEQT